MVAADMDEDRRMMSLKKNLKKSELVQSGAIKKSKPEVRTLNEDAHILRKKSKVNRRLSKGYGLTRIAAVARSSTKKTTVPEGTAVLRGKSSQRLSATSCDESESTESHKKCRRRLGDSCETNLRETTPVTSAGKRDESCAIIRNDGRRNGEAFARIHIGEDKEDGIYPVSGIVDRNKLDAKLIALLEFDARIRNKSVVDRQLTLEPCCVRDSFGEFNESKSGNGNNDGTEVRPERDAREVERKSACGSDE